LELKLLKNTFKIDSDQDKTIQLEKDYAEDKVTDFITIKMSRECIRNSGYVLSLDYEGQINSNLYGLYNSYFYDENINKVK
jgi:hypothetical protein